MRFKDIPAHDSLKEQLASIVDSNRIPHAMLLEGPRGTGKMMLARALAQYIHCTGRHDGDSCGVCPSCIQHQSFNHIDTHFSFPVLKQKGKSSNPVSDDYIAEWRRLLSDDPYMDMNRWVELLGNANGQPVIYVDESAALIRKLNFTSHAARYKIVLMWLPERMNESCANKLLKLIEEPHDDTLFILVSDEPAKILPTIYSRLRRIQVKRLPDEVVARYLQEHHSVDPQAAASIAHLSDGSILDALHRLSTSDESHKFLEMFISLMRLAYQRKVALLRKWAAEAADMGREQSCRFLDYCERLTGENYICNLNNPALVFMDDAESAFSSKFSRFINERNVMDLRQLFIEARRDIAGNGNAKMIFFDLAVQVILKLK